MPWLDNLTDAVLREGVSPPSINGMRTACGKVSRMRQLSLADLVGGAD